MASALGFPLPDVPNTTAGDGTRTALWLGPDEWLIVGPAGSERALEALLADALPRDVGSVVGLSANRTVLELRGPARARRARRRAARSTCTRAPSGRATARRRCSRARP